MNARAQRGSRWGWTILTVAVFALLAPVSAAAQANLVTKRGQRVAPIYEGWMQNSDGTFDLVFGYYNLNSEEIVDVPVGPDNSIEPGGPDMGQPAYFFPKRSYFTFHVTVPADFGDKELIWKLTANGKTEYAFATLKPDYIIDERIMMLNNGGFGGRGQRLGEPDNVRPAIRLEGNATRTTRVGEPVALMAYASDDGNPRGGLGGSNDLGLGTGWVVYRGTGSAVRMEPEQEHPEYRQAKRTEERLVRTALRSNNRPSAAVSDSATSQDQELPPPDVVKDREVPVTATFSAPGTYTLRAMAHDGGLAATADVTITVTP